MWPVPRKRVGALRERPLVVSEMRPSGYGPQEAGRSSGLPVHWPLCPAPLPPFVGGFALPAAAAGRDAAKTPATTTARIFLIGKLLSSGDSAQPLPRRLSIALLFAGLSHQGALCRTFVRRNPQTANFRTPADGPNPTSALEGASDLVIQDICPGRQVRHVDMAFDAVAYAALRDAMRHRGPAEASRLRGGQACDRQYVGNVTPDYVSAVNIQIIQNIFAAPRLGEEPPVTIRRPR